MASPNHMKFRFKSTFCSSKVRITTQDMLIDTDILGTCIVIKVGFTIFSNQKKTGNHFTGTV
jgi:hypothetical protein